MTYITKKSSELQQWTDSTRPVNPIDRTIGFNVDRNRIEYFLVLADAWYYAYPVLLSLPPTTLPAMSDNFETGWYVMNSFNTIFSENFKMEWYVMNSFNTIFSENFEGMDW